MKKLITENPFKNLNDSNVKYWLGWLASDGTINENRIILSLKSEDRDVIEKFRDFLSKDINIYDGIHKKSFGDFKFSRIAFRNTEITNYLHNLGITKNKTINLKINFQIDWFYLRGFFEGDGSIDFPKKSKRPRCQLVGSSYEHIIQICNFLKKENIYFSFYEKSKNRKNRHWSIEIIRKSEVLKFLTKLYENADIYMNRKYLNAMQAINGLISTP